MRISLTTRSFRTIAAVLALLGAQLVLADHAYAHDNEPHPVSCELCLQAHGGADLALTGESQGWNCNVVSSTATFDPDGGLLLTVTIANHPARAPPLR